MHGPTFGLALEADPQYGQAYDLEINTKSGTAHLFSSLKVTCKAIRLPYIVEIAGHCIFSKPEASNQVSIQVKHQVLYQAQSNLASKSDSNIVSKSVNWNGELSEIDLNDIAVGSNVGPDFSPTNQFTLNRMYVGSDVGPSIGSTNCITVIDNRACAVVKSDTVKLSPFQDADDIDLEDVYDNDALNLDIATIQAIAALRSSLDFLEDTIPTDVIQIVINSVTLQAITLAEQALGKFTHRKLKNMDTCDE